jgi:hypothetical protein
MSGVSDSSSRTLASNGVNDLGTGARSYFGGRSEANARSTVARPIPNCRATRRRGTPSATSRLINAQSSTEITHPICLGGLVFDRRYGLIFERCRQEPQVTSRHRSHRSPAASARRSAIFLGAWHEATFPRPGASQLDGPIQAEALAQ